MIPQSSLASIHLDPYAERLSQQMAPPDPLSSPCRYEPQKSVLQLQDNKPVAVKPFTLKPPRFDLSPKRRSFTPPPSSRTPEICGCGNIAVGHSCGRCGRPWNAAGGGSGVLDSHRYSTPPPSFRANYEDAVIVSPHVGSFVPHMAAARAVSSRQLGSQGSRSLSSGGSLLVHQQQKVQQSRMDSHSMSRDASHLLDSRLVDVRRVDGRLGKEQRTEYVVPTPKPPIAPLLSAPTIVYGEPYCSNVTVIERVPYIDTAQEIRAGVVEVAERPPPHVPTRHHTVEIMSHAERPTAAYCVEEKYKRTVSPLPERYERSCRKERQREFKEHREERNEARRDSRRHKYDDEFSDNVAVSERKREKERLTKSYNHSRKMEGGLLRQSDGSSCSEGSERPRRRRDNVAQGPGEKAFAYRHDERHTRHTTRYEEEIENIKKKKIRNMSSSSEDEKGIIPKSEGNAWKDMDSPRNKKDGQRKLQRNNANEKPRRQLSSDESTPHVDDDNCQPERIHRKKREIVEGDKIVTLHHKKQKNKLEETDTSSDDSSITKKEAVIQQGALGDRPDQPDETKRTRGLPTDSKTLSEQRAVAHYIAPRQLPPQVQAVSRPAIPKLPVVENVKKSPLIMKVKSSSPDLTSSSASLESPALPKTALCKVAAKAPPFNRVGPAKAPPLPKQLTKYAKQAMPGIPVIAQAPAAPAPPAPAPPAPAAPAPPAPAPPAPAAPAPAPPAPPVHEISPAIGVAGENKMSVRDRIKSFERGMSMEKKPSDLPFSETNNTVRSLPSSRSAFSPKSPYSLPQMSKSPASIKGLTQTAMTITKSPAMSPKIAAFAAAFNGCSSPVMKAALSSNDLTTPPPPPPPPKAKPAAPQKPKNTASHSETCEANFPRKVKKEEVLTKTTTETTTTETTTTQSTRAASASPQSSERSTIISISLQKKPKTAGDAIERKEEQIFSTTSNFNDVQNSTITTKMTSSSLQELKKEIGTVLANVNLPDVECSVILHDKGMKNGPKPVRQFTKDGKPYNVVVTNRSS